MRVMHSFGTLMNARPQHHPFIVFLKAPFVPFLKFLSTWYAKLAILSDRASRLNSSAIRSLPRAQHVQTSNIAASITQVNQAPPLDVGTYRSYSRTITKMKPQGKHESSKARVARFHHATPEPSQKPLRRTKTRLRLRRRKSNKLKRAASKREKKKAFEERMKALENTFEAALRQTERDVENLHEERLDRLGQTFKEIDVAYNCVMSESKKTHSQIIVDSVTSMHQQAFHSLEEFAEDAKKAQLEQLAKTKEMATKWKDIFMSALGHQAADHQTEITQIRHSLRKARRRLVDSPFVNSFNVLESESDSTTDSERPGLASRRKNWSGDVQARQNGHEEEQNETEPHENEPGPAEPPEPKLTSGKSKTVFEGARQIRGRKGVPRSSYEEANARSNEQMSKLASFMMRGRLEEEEEGYKLLDLNGAKLSDQSSENLIHALKVIGQRNEELETENQILQSELGTRSRDLASKTSALDELRAAREKTAAKVKEFISNIDAADEWLRKYEERESMIRNGHRPEETPEMDTMRHALAQEVTSADFSAPSRPGTARTWEHGPSSEDTTFPTYSPGRMPELSNTTDLSTLSGLPTTGQVNSGRGGDTEARPRITGTTYTTSSRFLWVDPLSRYDIPDHGWPIRSIAYQYLYNLIISIVEPLWHSAYWLFLVVCEVRQLNAFKKFHRNQPADPSQPPRRPRIPLMPSSSLRSLLASVFLFAVFQVYISASRERQIWLQANGLTRKYMLKTYASRRSWMLIPDVDGDLTWGFKDPFILAWSLIPWVWSWIELAWPLTVWVWAGFVGGWVHWRDVSMLWVSKSGQWIWSFGVDGGLKILEYVSGTGHGGLILLSSWLKSVPGLSAYRV